jgi:hypothetical protein
VIGRAEVSHETDGQRICALADYVVTGWGDVSFPRLAGELLREADQHRVSSPGVQPPLDTLALPYAEYTDEDVRQRHLYVEASRGCPFKCEFCLSALDKTAWPFPLQTLPRDALESPCGSAARASSSSSTAPSTSRSIPRSRCSTSSSTSSPRHPERSALRCTSS